MDFWLEVQHFHVQLEVVVVSDAWLVLKSDLIDLVLLPIVEHIYELIRVLHLIQLVHKTALGLY